MDESCHICMSHVTYELVMSHTCESRHIWMSHVTYAWVTSHMDESCHIRMSHVTYGWVMSHINESCRVYDSHHTWASQSKYRRVMAHTWLSYFFISCMSHTDESFQTWRSHMWMHHVMRNVRHYPTTTVANICVMRDIIQLCVMRDIIQLMLDNVTHYMLDTVARYVYVG